MTVQLTKMVLFAQMAAALSTSDSSGGGSRALGQVIPLLVLTLVYWAYLRLFVPLASFVDMFGEVGRRAGNTAVGPSCRLPSCRPGTENHGWLWMAAACLQM